jgi:hypothetical protein
MEDGSCDLVSRSASLSICEAQEDIRKGRNSVNEILSFTLLQLCYLKRSWKLVLICETGVHCVQIFAGTETEP